MSIGRKFLKRLPFPRGQKSLKRQLLNKNFGSSSFSCWGRFWQSFKLFLYLFFLLFLSYGLNDEATSLSREFIEDIVQPILKDHFKRDEFLGRINEILYFLPFNDIELRELTLRELQKW